jgi:hypothetical protein
MSPKELFLLNEPKAQAHRELSGRADFREALMIAFNQLCWHLPKADNPNTSWAANARRQGAQEFMYILLTLGNPQEFRKERSDVGTLEDQDAYYRKHTGSGTNSSTDFPSF